MFEFGGRSASVCRGSQFRRVIRGDAVGSMSMGASSKLNDSKGRTALWRSAWNSNLEPGEKRVSDAVQRMRRKVRKGWVKLGIASSLRDKSGSVQDMRNREENPQTVRKDIKRTQLPRKERRIPLTVGRRVDAHKVPTRIQVRLERPPPLRIKHYSDEWSAT